MLLVVYGAISLWLDKTTIASDATKQKFCELLICPPPNNDSPTTLASPPGETLARARTNLLMNPASAYRWADLADSEINANHIDAGRFCVRQALGSAPGNPAILFRAANFYLRLEDYPQALQNLLAVLRNPDLSQFFDRVFALYSAMDVPLDKLLNQGLPHTPQAANAFLRFWVNQNRLDEAEATWTWINKNSLTSLQSAGSYVALLAKDGRWDEAMQSWSDYTAHLDSAYDRSNWVYNGSFEMQPVECPFDWHLAPRDFVQVTRDTEQAYKGGACLRLHFSGAPEKVEAQAYQVVLLKPGKWQLKAAMKTLGLTSDQGVVVRIVDAEDPARLDVSTDTFQRTQEWTTVSRAFAVSGATRLARVEILRPPARDIDINFSGTVWIDAVQLAPEL